MKNSPDKKKVYFNAAQQKIILRGCNTTVVVGGRRLGKSHGIIAPFVLRNAEYMPGSKNGILASTFQQALTRTLPGTLKALEDFGYKRNVHYVINRRPEKKLGFRDPITPPEKYDNCITWYNGSIHQIISQDGVGTSNSLTLDSLAIDEAKFIDFQKLNEETLPAVGGFKGYFDKSAFYRSKLFVSDMPTSKRGSWFLRYEKDRDLDMIAGIDAIIYEMWRIKERMKTEKNYPDYLISEYKTYAAKLAKFRRISVDYNELSTLENLEVLGESYIKQMKRDLPPLVFMTSILCLKIKNTQDGFYNNLKENIHYYSSFDNGYLLNLDYDLTKASDISCMQDGDLDINSPIHVAFDYNANINWMVCGQRNNIKLNVLKSFFVKYECKLIELVDDFCKYYRYQKRKEVVYYYDTTALGSNYAVNGDDFKSVIANQFSINGWAVRAVFVGNPMKHHEKHSLINMGLKGQKGLFPMFNRDNNEDLLMAMEQCDVYISTNGFRKDKRGEKLAESEEDKLESRTDGTDAFDTLYIGMNNFHPGDSSFITMSSFV